MSTVLSVAALRCDPPPPSQHSYVTVPLLYFFLCRFIIRCELLHRVFHSILFFYWRRFTALFGTKLITASKKIRKNIKKRQRVLNGPAFSRQETLTKRQTDKAALFNFLNSNLMDRKIVDTHGPSTYLCISLKT